MNWLKKLFEKKKADEDRAVIDRIETAAMLLKGTGYHVHRNPAFVKPEPPLLAAVKEGE